MKGASSVLLDMIDERRRQDAQWGGPEHDDTHSSDDWFKYISYQIDRARYDTDKRSRLIKIAALATAAVESFDRINGEA